MRFYCDLWKVDWKERKNTIVLSIPRAYTWLFPYRNSDKHNKQLHASFKYYCEMYQRGKRFRSNFIRKQLQHTCTSNMSMYNVTRFNQCLWNWELVIVSIIHHIKKCRWILNKGRVPMMNQMKRTLKMTNYSSRNRVSQLHSNGLVFQPILVSFLLYLFVILTTKRICRIIYLYL